VGVRILTWNLSHRGTETWDRLAGLASHADVALVQEARPPDARVWRSLAEADACPPIDQPREWASVRSGSWPAGVVALGSGASVRPRPEYHQAANGLGRSHRGTLVVSDLYRAGRYVLTVASVYGMVQLDPGCGRLTSYDALDRVVDDLVPLMADAEVPLVLGGNFNTCALPAAHAPGAGVPQFFDRLASYGMVDCLQADKDTPRHPLPGCPCGDPVGCRHVRTCRDAAGRPLQTDYLFASQGLADALHGCTTIDGNDVWSASSHCPVVATFAPEAQ
jgi:hypothetical protein